MSSDCAAQENRKKKVKKLFRLGTNDRRSAGLSLKVPSEKGPSQKNLKINQDFDIMQNFNKVNKLGQ